MYTRLVIFGHNSGCAEACMWKFIKVLWWEQFIRYAGIKEPSKYCPSADVSIHTVA
jgi:hypothetical protein